MKHKGFTLIELLVSVAIFSVVMLIALGALLAISEADRRAETLKSVINNLNFSLDSMTRAMRTGSTYDGSAECGSTPSGNDCEDPPGSTSFTFLDAQGRTVVYKLQGSSIVRSVDGGSNFATLTAPEVVISKLEFYTTGTSLADQTQPKVTILISGKVVVTPKLNSDFNLQASVTQRLYDQ